MKQAEEYKKVIEVVFDNSIRAFESKILSVERYAAKEKAELARQRHQWDINPIGIITEYRQHGLPVPARLD